MTKLSPSAPSGEQIRTMFDALAPRYDRFNRMVSLGMDGRWRAEVLRSVEDGTRVLDLGCGTGDLTFGAAQRMRRGEVVGLDFSAAMLDLAQKRAQAFRRTHPDAATVRFVRASAEQLPLDERPFDLVVSGFVLRNIYERIERVLMGVHRSLKDGGRIAFIDFTEPAGTLRPALWKTYMNTVGAACGLAAFGKDYPAFYLTDSAKRFLKPEDFCSLLRENGFRHIRLKRLMMGIIVLYEAERA